MLRTPRRFTVIGRMINYRKAWLGLPLMARWIGSALPRALIPALVSTVLCTLLEAFVPTEVLVGFFDHPYPFQVFASAVAFALVFRTNIAYNRYWEMRTDVQKMSSKWADAAAFVLAFEQSAAVREAAGARAHQGAARARFVPSGTMAPSAEVSSGEPPDAQTAEEAAGVGIEGVAESSESTSSLPLCSQALLLHRFSLMHALALQYLRRDNLLHLLVADHAINTEATGLGLTNGAARRAAEGESCIAEGKGERGFARGEGLVRTLFADQDDPVRHMRHLEAHPLPVLGGVTLSEIKALEFYEDRVGFVFSLLLGSLSSRRRAGGLDCEPPVFTRAHHTISDGMLGYQQAKKVEDTPFPFPYAQLTTFMLYAFALLFPLLVASKVGSDTELDTDAAGFTIVVGTSHIVAPLLAFVTVLSYFGMHEVARELEDPFVQ